MTNEANDSTGKAAQLAADLVWMQFVATGTGLTRRQLIVELHKRGHRLDTDAVGEFGITVSGDLHRGSRVRIDAALQRPDGRELLAKLPELLRLAAARVLKLPRSEMFSSEGATMTSADIVEIFGSHRGPLVEKLLTEWNRLDLFGGWSGNAEGRTYRLRPSVLRYAEAQTLDDVMAVAQANPRVKIGRYPTGRHLSFIRAVHEFVVAHGHWPHLSELPIAPPQIAFLPATVSDLHEAGFLNAGFQPDSMGEIRALMTVLPFVDSDGSVHQGIVRVVTTAAKLWIEDESGTVHESDLLAKTGMSRAELLPVLLYVKYEPWTGETDIGSRSRSWDMRCDERVLDYERVTNYSEYEDVREASTSPAWGIPFDVEPSLAQATPVRVGQFLEIDLSFMLDEKLQRVARDDIGSLNAGVADVSPKAALVLIGSLLEAVLLDIVKRNPPRARQTRKDFEPRTSGLEDLIVIARKENLLRDPPTGPSGMAAGWLKDARNFIHPYRLAHQPELPNARVAAVAIALANNLLHELATAIEDGRVTAYESPLPSIPPVP